MSDKNIETLESDEPIEGEPLESGPVEPQSTGDPEPLASGEEGTLIKDFPLATSVNDDDDMIIETNLPQTEHVKAETFRDYVVKDAILEAYPVGAIYLSTVATSPAILFGGEWEEIYNRFLVAAGSNYTAGVSGGSSTVTLSESNLPAHTHSLPSHTHSLPAHTHSLPSHTHSLPSHTHSLPSHTHSIPSHTHSFSATTSSSGSHSHTVNYNLSVFPTGGRQRQYHPSGEDGSTTFTNSAGAHTHTISGTTGSYSGTSGSTSGTSGSTSGTSGSTSGTSGSTEGTSGSASGTSGSTGSGTAFSIVPPYLAVYMWQRTA